MMTLFLTLLACAVLFATASVRPSMAAGLAAQYLGGFIAGGQDGRVNWIAAVLALYAAFVALQSGWRYMDSVAVGANDEGLSFHPSTLRGKLGWAEVDAVRFVSSRSSGRLMIVPTAGPAFGVGMVDPLGGAWFAREVTERWLALPPAESAM